ncbi:ABC-three component system middle component 6 [Micromonospora sp. NPDC093277]|uniref:ABC-three component system middle component 6 n=1 Tax=Micromonospora sp. NPDC093277 TaxID=3364291 RepID=UPI003812C0A6
MILPDKYVGLEHSLLGQAATLIRVRGSATTVADLWAAAQADMAYERFVLALDLLFMIGVVDGDGGGVLRWSR